jgi:hypothetical protein
VCVCIYLFIISGDDKYAEFVYREGGMPLLKAVIEHDDSSVELKKLALMAREHTHVWMDTKWLVCFYII